VTGAAGSEELIQQLEEVMGPGSGQFFQHLIAQGAAGFFPDGFRLEVPGAALVNLNRSAFGGLRRGQAFSASIRVERAPRPSGHRQGREFEPLPTVQRWIEETKILHGDFVNERITKLVNHVALALLPACLEAAKQAKLREEEEAARIAAEREKEEAKKLEEAKSKPEAETAEAETSSNEQMDAEPTSASPTAPPAEQQEVKVPDTQPTTESHTSASPDISESTEQADEVMAEASNADTNDAEMADAEDSNQEQPSTTTDGSPEASTSQQQPEASASAAPERITVMIHGSPVDITDTGIDPDFLAALPDDMREEVLNQHVRDQRAARVERPADSQISTEFLDALPPDIRAEILQQEAMERERRRAEESAAAPRGPAEIDPASFIASLDPTLRQAVLMEQDEGFIASLPSHMLAEVEEYRGPGSRRHLATRSAPPRVPPQAQPPKPRPQHDAIQLLDKAGIATLVRLLFFPQVLRKTLLFKVLVNLCENSKTRTELFNLLLSILQDGTGDLAAVDKSFAQMSVRTTKPQTPKSVGKQKLGPEYLSSLALPASQMEAFPDLIAQKCLDALSYIVTSNELASLFFLTEHELPAGLRKSSTKKGKGKEKQVPQSHYPIVLLLGLLDRQSLLRTPAIMESVVGLLAIVTRPLTSLKDAKPAASISGPSIGGSDQQTEASAVAPPSEAPAATLPPPPDSQAPSTETVAQPGNSNRIARPISITDSAQAIASSTPAATTESEPKIETVEEKVLLSNPPQIPHAVLRLIVNILTIGECSGRTFQQSLALIQHLSYIPDARDVIAQELKAKAQEFGQTLIGDLEELAKALQDTDDDAMTSCIANKFSPASSTQAKLLRVLKTIDYMYTPKASSTTAKDKEKEKSQDIEKVQAIYESFRFSTLWKKLGCCLEVIDEKPDTEHIATVLLPLIESLMVVCKYVGSTAQSTIAARAARGATSPKSPTTPTPKESMEELFISFTDAHRKVLNLMVRNNPSLMSGSFSLLVNNPRVLDFDNKRNYFNQQLHRRPHMREHHGTLQLNVRRARVFEDSFQYLQRKSGDQIKYGKLNVRFYDEEGVDAGGVTREWFQILARQMFDPNNALFQPCAADKLTYQPNKNSWVNPEHLSFFKFVGRVIGKAIYDGRLLDAYFARSLYRQLLNKPVDYKDVEWVDPEYYKSLCWILENDPTILDLNFSVEADEVMFLSPVSVH
jgi:E3 ubiquitin-protein ligase HUWE1